ncbi:MAG: transglutaminase-like domain-containing protein [Bradymonadia bacterium]
MKLNEHKWHVLGVGSICLAACLLFMRAVDGQDEQSNTTEMVSRAFKPGKSIYSIYYQAKPVGDVRIERRRIEGGGFDYDVKTRFRFKAFGEDLGIRMALSAHFDDGFGLNSVTFSMSSGQTTVQGTGAVKGDELTLIIQTGGSENRFTLPYDQDLIIGSVMGSRITAENLQPGDVRQFRLLDPLTQSVRKIKLRAIEYEDVYVLDRKISALKVEQETMGVVLTAWVREDGEVIRQDLGMGLTAQLEPEATVTFNQSNQTDLVDLAEALLVPVTNMPKNYDQRPQIRYRLSQLNSTLRLTVADHQTWKEDELTITRTQVPARVDFEISEHPLPSPDLLAQSAEGEIRSQALSIVSDVRSAQEVIRRILSWFKANIEQRPVASLPAALETLRTRSGDCNEHAFLFAGLLRSIGIEAKVMTGIAYVARLRRFGYHAWNEVKIGEKWVVVDPTWQQFPADVTHIALAQGGLQAQSTLWSLMGRLSVTVIE